MINETKWQYSIPENYIFRVNNPINSNNSKKENHFENPEDMSENQYILFTASKKLEGLKKWSDSNLVMATYTKAKFIKKYGSLKKYLSKNKEFLDKTYLKEKSKPEILISEINIADRKFDVMTQNFLNFQNKFTFTSVTYHTIIENELLEISILYNNDEDKEKLLKTIENSKFYR